MIGQSSIIRKYINGFDSLPSSMILLGPQGSGKRTLLNTLSHMMNVEVIDLPKTITDDIKSELIVRPKRAIICVDLSSNTQHKQILSIQNSLLKFIEDIPINYKVFILADDESYLLNTILNRCYVQSLELYTNRELRLIAEEYGMDNVIQYSDKEFEYMEYPKDVLLNIPVDTIHSMESLVSTIFDSISRANVSNTLSIIRRFKFTDSSSTCSEQDTSLWDINIFLNILNKRLVDILINNYDKRYFDMFSLLSKLKFDMNKATMNKVHLFERFLLDVKYIL